MVITMGLSNSFIVLDRKLLEYRSVHYRPATNFLWTERHRLLEQRDGDMAISRSTVASARAMVITHCHRAFELGNGGCPERNGSQNETARKAEKKK